MKQSQVPVGAGPSVVYWTYAAAAWVGGFVVMNEGAHWFGPHLPGRPWGLASLMRIIGVLIIAGGCFAAALARMDDVFARRKARTWFLAANAIVFIMAIIQFQAVWGGGPAEWAAEILFVVVLFGVLVGAEEAGLTSGDYLRMTSLFGRTPQPTSFLPRPMMTTSQLRSRYEQQIREAAGQEERNRLARELHDSIKQQLFVVQTAAATAQARWEQDRGGARTALEQVRASARDAMLEMEVMLDQLRAAPLENLGLVEAIKKQCEALRVRTGAQVACTVGPLPAEKRLPPGAQQAIFRVLQEATANIARHARATDLNVTLIEEANELRLIVKDNGQGFDSDRAASGMGLANMRERAEEFGGQASVVSKPGAGTTVMVTIPCLPPDLEIPDYRLQVRLWAVLLVIQVAFGVWNPEMLILALIPAGFLARSVGQLRQRQQGLR